jgi:peroxiredoxin
VGRCRLSLRPLTAAWLGAVFVVAAVAPALAQKPIDFTLRDTEGNAVSLSDFLGKNVVLIDFWATWCVPCVKELTHFQRFYEAYKDKGLIVLALAEDGPESVAMVKPFAKRYNYTFTVLLDTESRVLALYDPRVVLPYTLLIDRSGRIAKVHQGYSLGDEKKLEQEILDLLEPKEAAAGQKIAVGLNEAVLYRNFSDRDYVRSVRGGRDSQVINRLDLTVAAGAFLAGGRVDADYDFSPTRGEFSLAKKFLEFNSKNFQARVGDYYYTVGRGLAFSLLKTFEKEGLEYIIDTTVAGGKAVAALGNVTAEAFGGWIDRVSSGFSEAEAVRDTVYGGTLGWSLKNVGGVKAHFVGSDLKPGSTLGNRSVAMESIALDIPNVKGVAKFYGEALLIRKKKYYADDPVTGHGVYLESGVFFKNLTFLFEFKDYKNLDFEYNRPPLLESEQIPVVASQFANISKDITGAACRVDYYFPKTSTLLFGKVSYLDDIPLGARRTIGHLFAGVEKKFKETGWLTVLAGYRQEDSSSLIYYYTTGRTFHYQANLSYPFTKRLSLEADLEGKDFRGDLAFGGKTLNYYERRSYVSLCYSPTWILTVFFDQTTDPEILTYKNRKNWFGGQLEVKFSQANYVRIFVGANKGGVKCAGGVCKFFPPFEGVRVDSVFRF